MRGGGRGKTVILIDDTSSGGDGISNSSDGNTFPALANFHMRDLTVSGMRATIATTGSQILRLGNGSNISIVDCEFIQSRNFGLVIGNSDQVTVRGNRIFHTNGDGIAVWGDSNLVVDSNEIIGANDDSISANASDGDAVPIRSGVVITNNTITESQGISVGGAKNVLIANNVMRRMMGYGINAWSYSGGTQGNTNEFGLKIINNSIHDVFLRAELPFRNQAQAYIFVFGGPKTNGAAASPPGTPASGAGTVATLYGSNSPGIFYDSGTFAAPPANPGAYWVEVSGNELVRTLPAVSSYSQWGYGASLFVGNNGGSNGGGVVGSYNGPIAEANLNTNGISDLPGLQERPCGRQHHPDHWGIRHFV